jgi:hypothetical protein
VWAARDFEWLMCRPPEWLGIPREQAVEVSEVTAASRRPGFGILPQYPLPKATNQTTDSNASLLAMELATIATLAQSATRRPSVEVYFVAQPGSIGALPWSVFRYDADAHALVATRSDGAWPNQELLDSGETFPPLAIVLVGSVGILFHHHGEFAYRLAHLDSGQATFELCQQARALGLGVQVMPQTYDLMLFDLLELQPEQEIITAILNIIQPEERYAATS